MDWYDVDEILLDGSKEDIETLKCPECGGNLEYHFSKGEKPNSGALRVICRSCGIVEKLHGISGEPSCVTFFPI